MKKLGNRAYVLLALTVVLFIAPDAIADEKPILRVMFGSCCRENRPQPIWESIVAAEPEMFLFIGDNIYGDSRDVNVLKAKYETLFANEGFTKLRETCPLLATWDDHDYGENDAGVEYPIKAQSQKLFNDVYGVVEDSPRRKRPGIYDSQIIGPEGKRLQIILLDTRYFRDKLRSWPRGERPQGRGPYRPHEGDENTILGEAQWAWLEGELKKPAEVRIIASSIQVIPYQHGWESWGNFPSERKRLFEIIAKTKAGGVLFISGDRHHGELSRIEPADSGVGYALFDATSSSLNQPSGGGNRGEPNRYRLGENFPQINFGQISIDWDKEDPVVTVAIKGGDGKELKAQNIDLSDLQP